MGRKREKGKDDEINDQEDEGDAKGETVSKGERVKRRKGEESDQAALTEATPGNEAKKEPHE